MARARWIDVVVGMAIAAIGTILLPGALIFLTLAFLASLLGFTGIAAAAWVAAKVLFFVFLILVLVSAFFGGRRQSVP
jgi:uncharacterized membrane protein YtjA (UPF0391 family)